MKRTIAILGVAGVGLLGAMASANAAPPEKITICHATGSASNPYIAETINVSALAAHVTDTLDIVPVNSGTVMPDGQNLTPANLRLLAAGCVAPVDPEPTVSPTPEPTVVPTPEPTVVPTPEPTVDPVVPPVDPPTDQVVPVPPVEAASAVVPAPPVQTAAKATVAKAAPAAPASNVGYNVQTAVGDKTGPAIPAWLATLTGLFTAVAGLVLYRGSARARNANS